MKQEDAIDRCKWRNMIKDVRWSGWVWVGECFFWYRPTQVVLVQRPLNSCVCVCVCVSVRARVRVCVYWFFWAYTFCFFPRYFFSCLVPCTTLNWLTVSFWAHVNITHSFIQPTNHMFVHVFVCRSHLFLSDAIVHRHSAAGSDTFQQMAPDSAVRRCVATYLRAVQRAVLFLRAQCVCLRASTRVPFPLLRPQPALTDLAPGLGRYS